VRVAHGGHRVRITEGGEQRHGLGCLERQVEPGDLPATEPAERLGRSRVEPTPDRVQVVRLDVTGETKVGRRGPGPSTGRFADPAVVLVDAISDGIDVVALAVESDLADAEHEGPPRGRVPAVSQIAVPGQDSHGGTEARIQMQVRARSGSGGRED
jgi:hypothetical protein